MATLMECVALVICPFAPISSGPPERTQLHRSLVRVCVCLRRVPPQLSGRGTTGRRDNQSPDWRSGSGAVGPIHLNQDSSGVLRSGGGDPGHAPSQTEAVEVTDGWAQLTGVEVRRGEHFGGV